MTRAANFKGDYSPGGLGGRARRRVLARRAGLASGVKRRQLAHGRRPGERKRTRGTALALRYPIRQITRDQFEALYRQHWPQGNAAGAETCWRAYVALFRLYRARGQHAGTTNAQRALALEALGRARCRRTVQRTHRKLAVMGVAVVSWYRDQRDTPGHKDHLIAELRNARLQECHPPYGSGSRPTAQAPAFPPNDLNPPPLAAETEPPAKPAGQPATERQELERHIGLCEQKIAAGWPAARQRAMIGYLRARLRALDGDGHDP